MGDALERRSCDVLFGHDRVEDRARLGPHRCQVVDVREDRGDSGTERVSCDERWKQRLPPGQDRPGAAIGDCRSVVARPGQPVSGAQDVPYERPIAALPVRPGWDRTAATRSAIAGSKRRPPFRNAEPPHEDQLVTRCATRPASRIISGQSIMELVASVVARHACCRCTKIDAHLRSEKCRGISSTFPPGAGSPGRLG